MDCLYKWVEKLLNRDTLGCRAVVDKDSGEICGGEIYGSSTLDSGHEIGYCILHEPISENEKTRIFYNSETDEFIELS